MAKLNKINYQRKKTKTIAILLAILTSPLQLIAFLIIRILKPFIIIRIGWINSTRIGHMAGNMELFFILKDIQDQNSSLRYLDVWCCTQEYVCNDQLLRMLKRKILIFPRWSLTVLAHLNLAIPGGSVHHISDNNSDRDIYNLLDRTSPHLDFTQQEEEKGSQMMRKLGIPINSKIICLIVRDAEYLNYFYSANDWSYHNHRDSNIQDYLLAIETLANRGYYVIRMGAKVREPLNSSHPRVIDYASNGMRTEFMDIYLGAKCFFAISTATGWDAIPLIFRRPIAFVNVAPLGFLFTFSSKILAIAKHHISKLDGRELTMKEIFSRNVGFYTSNYEFNDKGVELVDNTPEEIRDLVVEMADRLEGVFQSKPEDKKLQSTFRKIFPKNAKDDKGIRLHGKIYSRYGSIFLRNNLSWLE